MTPAILQRQDLIYPDLSYKIVGVLLNVSGKLGYGLYEKTYQKAVAVGLTKIGLNYIEQLYAPVIFGIKIFGQHYLDFLGEWLMAVALN